MEQVTVVVFKDHYASRTFRVPLKWMSRFGFLIGGLGFLTLVSVVAATRAHWLLRRSTPEHALDLERQLTEVQVRNNTLVAQVAELQNKANSAGTSSAPPTTQAQTRPLLNPSYRVDPLLANALPSSQPMQLADPETLPFKLTEPKVGFRGRNLRVQFAINYTRGDGGNQQGRIVILAKGPSAIQSYPSGIFSTDGSSAIVRPERGEFFSVSRYREVQASFSAFPTANDLKEVEILIFDSTGPLIFMQRVAAPASGQKAVPKAADPGTAPLDGANLPPANSETPPAEAGSPPPMEGAAPPSENTPAPAN